MWIDLESDVAEMFDACGGCFTPQHDHLGLRVATKYDVGATYEPKIARGRDMVAKRAYERKRLADPVKRQRELERKRNYRTRVKAARKVAA